MQVREGVRLVQSPEMRKNSRVMGQLIHYEGSSGQEIGRRVIAWARLHSIARGLENSEHAADGEVTPNGSAPLVGSTKWGGCHPKSTLRPAHQCEIVTDHLAGSRCCCKGGFPAP